LNQTKQTLNQTKYNESDQTNHLNQTKPNQTCCLSLGRGPSRPYHSHPPICSRASSISGVTLSWPFPWRT